MLMLGLLGFGCSTKALGGVRPWGVGVGVGVGVVCRVSGGGAVRRWCGAESPD